MEELIRAITSIFTRSFPIAAVRSKFSRLREILVVLTSDGSLLSSGSFVSDSVSQISLSDIQAVLALRLDLNQE